MTTEHGACSPSTIDDQEEELGRPFAEIARRALLPPPGRATVYFYDPMPVELSLNLPPGQPACTMHETGQGPGRSGVLQGRRAPQIP